MTMQSFQEGPHQKLFFDKIQESKDERRARLDVKKYRDSGFSLEKILRVVLDLIRCAE